MVFFGAKRLGNSLGPTRWCWASGPHGPCIQMYALCSPLLAKTHGGWGAGGLITFLGLDMGRRNHQGRNFYFFSLLLELLISTSPVLLWGSFALHSPRFLWSCGGTASQLYVKAWTHMLTCLSWLLVFIPAVLCCVNKHQFRVNMLGRMNLLKQWNRRPIKFEVTDDASDAPLTWIITWYTYTNLPNGCMQTWHIHDSILKDQQKNPWSLTYKARTKNNPNICGPRGLTESYKSTSLFVG